MGSDPVYVPDVPQFATGVSAIQVYQSFLLCAKLFTSLAADGVRVSRLLGPGRGAGGGGAGSHLTRHVAQPEVSDREADRALVPLPPPADGVPLVGQVVGVLILEIKCSDRPNGVTIQPLQAT